MQHSCSGYLYEVLELSQDCNTTDVQRQYRRLALRYHPDKTGGTTTEQFKTIEEAHRILADPEQRRVYDVFGREGLARFDSLGVPNFLLSIDRIRGILLCLSGFITLLLVNALAICYKLDHHMARWHWGLLMLPVWLMYPVLLLVAVSMINHAIANRSFISLVVGMELLSTMVATAATTAALAGALRPVWWALVAWAVWYALRCLRLLAILQPSVYAQLRKEREGHQEEGRGGGEAPGPDADPNYKPCFSGEYWAAVGATLWEIACVSAFAVLAFWKEAELRDAGANENVVNGGTEETEGTVLSLWVVCGPLLLCVGLRMVIAGMYACVKGHAGARNNREESAEEEEEEGGAEDVHDERARLRRGTHNREEGTAAAAAQSRTACDHITEAIVTMVPQGCLLYMLAMWTDRLEHQLNPSSSGGMSAAPTAFNSTLPLLIGLAVLAVIPCCMSCMLASVGKAMMEEANPSDRGRADDTATTANYHSTDATANAAAAASKRTFNSGGDVSARRAPTIAETVHVRVVDVDNID